MHDVRAGVTPGGSEIACGVKVAAAGSGSIFGAFSDEPQSRNQRWWLKSRNQYFYTVLSPCPLVMVFCPLPHTPLVNAGHLAFGGCCWQITATGVTGAARTWTVPVLAVDLLPPRVVSVTLVSGRAAFNQPGLYHYSRAPMEVAFSLGALSSSASPLASIVVCAIGHGRAPAGCTSPPLNATNVVLPSPEALGVVDALAINVTVRSASGLTGQVGN